MSNQNVLLGQFVAMGQRIFSECPKSAGVSIYTQEVLTTFLSDVEKNLPLYLENLDELKKLDKTAKMEEMFYELDRFYLLISCCSFRNFKVDEACFLQGYQEQMNSYS